MEEKENDKKAIGRPPKYNPELMNDLVFNLAKEGLTDKKLAKCLNICEATLNNWKQQYPELLESIKRGKDYADCEIEKSLYRRAMGYDYEEIDIAEEEESGAVTKRKVIRRKKQMASDPTSMIFWLKNRKKDEWRDRHDHTIVDNTEYEKQRARMDEIAQKIIERENENV